MEDAVTKYLLDRVEKEKHKIFNKEIEEGKRLSFNELRRLNTLYKKDYVSHLMKEDDFVREYIEEKENIIMDKHDKVNHAIYDLEDQ